MEGESKIPVKRIPSDDCAVFLNRIIDLEKETIIDPGTPYYLHKGEWVEVIPCLTMSDLIMANRLSGMAQNFSLSRAEDSITQLCNGLTKRIMAWNWTDLRGNPLSQPRDNPQVFLELTADELVYLIGLMGNETKSERKNACMPSETVSSGGI